MLPGRCVMAGLPTPNQPCVMKCHVLFCLLVTAGFLPAIGKDFPSVQVGLKPESVTRGFGGHYYVTVMNEGNVAGDGTVRKVENGKVTDFASGLDNPKGIVFVGNHLVTADMKKVWKISAEGEKSILAEEKDFPFPLGMLNDVAVAPSSEDEAVYVTDMGANARMKDKQGNLWPLDSQEARELPAIGRVYRISLTDGKVSLAVPANADMPCPNGVSAAFKGEILVGEFFTGNLISTDGSKREILATGYRGADAIERDAQRNLYVSSWVQGKVWKLDPDGKNARVLAEGFKSAADFYLDQEAGQIVLPDMLSGTIHFIPLN